MLKRINWKAVFICFAWLVSLSGVVVLMSFINVKKQTIKCADVRVIIPGADNFIEREEVDAILKEDQGVLIGKNLEDINIHKIEKKLIANPYIGYAKVYVDMDGVMHVEVKQRQPILRVINATGQNFYIDSDGLKMPISSNFTANVLVATGNIAEVFGSRVDTLHTQLAHDLYTTALYLKKDTLWDNQIEQINVDEKNDMILIPRVGDETIVLGNADSLDTKMRNLKAFYAAALPQVIARKYRSISIKYSNQVVCEKRDSLELLRSTKVMSTADSVLSRQKVTDSLINSSIAELNDEKPTPAEPKVVKTEATKVEVKKVEPKRPETKKPEAKVVEPKKTEVKKVEPTKKEVNKDKVAIQVEKPKTAKPDVKKETATAKPKLTDAEIRKRREEEIKALEKQYKTQQH
ncbi:cell division protein FtsQ/DivIB [Pedobacter sp. MW01-1-1]|uniref:cell division protein FtsQ/DivIB n=1 Tax=Pedobacter sp. MW01-1-1 TaxID=3383027 RepID=UPI003FF00E2A